MDKRPWETIKEFGIDLNKMHEYYYCKKEEQKRMEESIPIFFKSFLVRNPKRSV